MQEMFEVKKKCPKVLLVQLGHAFFRIWAEPTPFFLKTVTVIVKPATVNVQQHNPKKATDNEKGSFQVHHCHKPLDHGPAQIPWCDHVVSN